MLRLDVHHDLDDAQRASVHALLEAVHRHTGTRPLNDQLWLDLVHGGRAGFTAILVREANTPELVAYCQLSHDNGSWAIDLVVLPAADVSTVGPSVLATTVGFIAGAGGGHVHWWVTDPDQTIADIAVAGGFAEGRTLFQMRVPLPLPSNLATVDVLTRPFEVGRDETAWLGVNNAAFAQHAEQGGWTVATLRQREDEAWFDTGGFLIHERNGRMAAFCWTKLDTGTGPALGEIYVIAVHPDFHGLGLGKALTVAGLRSMTARGARTGMLYVDRDNTAAVGLYEHLGFSVHRVDREFVADVEAARPALPEKTMS